MGFSEPKGGQAVVIAGVRGLGKGLGWWRWSLRTLTMVGARVTVAVFK